MKLFISSSNTHGEFISYDFDKIVFIPFDTSSGSLLLWSMRKLLLLYLIWF